MLYKFDKAPSALLNSNGSCSGRMPLEAISSANHNMSGLVRQDTGQNSKTINNTLTVFTKILFAKSNFVIDLRKYIACEI